MTIKTIFQELRSKGHIRKTKYCRWSPFVENFKAGILFRRTMFYSKEYDNLDDNLLRFALLHEEGHHRGKQYTPLVLAIDIIVILASVFLICWKAEPMNEVIQPIIWGLLPIYIWLLFASLKIFSQYIHRDEFRSDSFAAETLRNAYKIDRPSENLDRLLKLIGPSEPLESIGWRIFRLLLGGLHPSDEERVKRIKNTIDNS